MNAPLSNTSTFAKNKFLIFLHIQKTGGITIQRVLRRKLGKSLLERLLTLMGTENSDLSVIENFKRKTLKDRYIVGHFCYGIHQHLPEPWCYASFLREPVSRVISLYEYSLDNPTAYYHKQAQGKTLEEFVLETPLMELDNGQVRFLAGAQDDFFINRTPIGECDQALLDRAIENIERDFILVGLTEYFDQSLLLMKEMMGWRSCLYLKRNVTKKQKKLAVSSELKEKIRAKNHLDVVLYQYAEERLKRQLTELGLDKPEILNDFRKQNAMFNRLIGKFYSLYDLIKSVLRGQLGRPS
jgi:hypothetical protein